MMQGLLSKFRPTSSLFKEFHFRIYVYRFANSCAVSFEFSRTVVLRFAGLKESGRRHRVKTDNGNPSGKDCLSLA